MRAGLWEQSIQIIVTAKRVPDDDVRRSFSPMVRVRRRVGDRSVEAEHLPRLHQRRRRPYPLRSQQVEPAELLVGTIEADGTPPWKLGVTGPEGLRCQFRRIHRERRILTLSRLWIERSTYSCSSASRTARVAATQAPSARAARSHPLMLPENMTGMERTIYTSDHKDFSESFAAFLRAHIAPHYPQWEADGIVPRDVFTEIGRGGFSAFAVDEQYGGAGVGDFRFNAILAETAFELDLAGFIAGLTLHNDICLPYFVNYCNDEQRRRWLPGIANGQYLTAIAMTEPGPGSDLAGHRDRCRPLRRWLCNQRRQDFHHQRHQLGTGDHSGTHRSGVIRTRDLAWLSSSEGWRALSGAQPGEGWHSMRPDTAEMFFNDVQVPRENLLGEEGMGFRYLTANLPQERLSISISAVAMARRVLDYTLAYVQDPQCVRQADRQLPEQPFRARRLGDRARHRELSTSIAASSL